MKINLQVLFGQIDAKLNYELVDFLKVLLYRYRISFFCKLRVIFEYSVE